MPPTPNPYQRVLLYGIPFWRDTEGILYAYETSTPPTAETRVRIGTERTGLDPNWVAAYAPLMMSYRESITFRARGPAKATVATAK